MNSAFGVDHGDISKAGKPPLPHFLGGPAAKPAASMAQRLDSIAARQPAPGKPQMRKTKGKITALIGGPGKYTSSARRSS